MPHALAGARPAPETAYAKLNLALHVRAREADGYHLIETLFAFTDDGDEIILTDTPGLSIDGPYAGALSDGDNLVLRAQRAFVAACGCGGDQGFHLTKQLPVAAGIGGGSADAGAALRLLCDRFGVDPSSSEISAIAASLGADVPACLFSEPVRGTGRGDRLVPVADVPAIPTLLVNPNLPLATGPVFAAWDGVDRGPLGAGEPLEVAAGGRNDLEAPAIGLLPVIGEVLALLRAQTGAGLVRMSGSGATCFALFDQTADRDAADRAIAAAQPGWWRLATRLR